MKWLVRLAAFCLGLGIALPAFAQCALPHILQNGTIADATQVMDNFNTVDGCVSNVMSSFNCPPIVSGLPVLNHGLCLDISVNLAGTNTAGPTTANLLHTINNNMNSGNSNFASTLLVEHEFGGSAVIGGQNSLEVDGYFDQGATSASNGNRNYVGVFGQMVGLNGDGGTDPTMSATSKGALFGGAFFGDAKAGIAFSNVSGMEVNVAAEAGTSVFEKTGVQIVDHPLDQVHGSFVDAALAIGGQIGSIGFNNAILLSNGNGDKPLTITGCVICTTANNQTIATGIDLSQYNITGFFLKSSNFFVTGAGAISGAGIFNIGANPGPGVQPNMIGSFTSSNFTGGLGETDYINLSNDAGGHYWYQRSAAAGGSYKQLAALSTLGLNVTGGVTTSTGFFAPLVTEPDTGPCAAGQINWDAGFIYVCTSTNVYKRVAVSSY